MLYPTAFFTNNHVSLHIYKNKLPMKILYYIYQICIALPILLVLTILTAIVTIVGSLLGGAHFWGYYPGKIWSQLICLFLLIPVKIHGREKLHGKTSYIFVPNHQGSFDIFLIYGFIGRNFKWMMKKSLRKIPFVGKACESAGHIFVDRSGPQKSTGDHSASKRFAERRGILSRFSRRSTYFHRTHGIFQKRGVSIGR